MLMTEEVSTRMHAPLRGHLHISTGHSVTLVSICLGILCPAAGQFLDVAVSKDLGGQGRDSQSPPCPCVQAVVAQVESVDGEEHEPSAMT